MNPYDFWTFMKNKKIVVDTNSTYVQNLSFRQAPVNARLASLLSSDEKRKRAKLGGRVKSEHPLRKAYAGYSSNEDSPEDAKTFDKLSNIMEVPEYRINNTIKKQQTKK
jgi:hypothetical protein